MKKNLTRPALVLAAAAASTAGLLLYSGSQQPLEASSHREAPLIADDPLADNTDLYAFRSPDAAANDANATVTLIANYIPFELPQGGPNFNTFGENMRYEIHVKNKPVTPRFTGDPVSPGDDIIYRFTFARTNQDPSTFFRIRLGQENLKTTYQLEEIRSTGTTTLVPAGTGIVAPPNVGPRSISARVTVPGVGTNVAAGLGQAGGYAAVMQAAVATLPNGMKVFCGPTDDPFFTDLGAIFDLGGVRPAQVQGGSNAGTARDGLARKNVHTIALQIPVRLLQSTGQNLTAATSILDPNFVIGVWASASRQATKTFSSTAPFQSSTGAFVQVSRIGMPLTNEVVQNIGVKDSWNAESPFGVPGPAAGTPQALFDARLMNPELGLYMADNLPVAPAAPKPAMQTYFGEAIAGFAPLRIQTKSLAGQPLLGGASFAGFDFRNGANGLGGLVGSPLLMGTALAPLASGGFGEYLLRPQTGPGQGNPRSVDLLPIFHTGVPNAIPYQLATGKNGNPLAAGKPFINNFLPTFGDMLRLNMAVPPTPRNSAAFSSEGLLAAAVAGLTDPAFANTTLQNIPNMDGFPNGRRLEDDVTRIELQAVSGVVLAAIGLWYDDYTPATASPVTAQLGGVLRFSTNIERNDTTFRAAFPYSQLAWSGTTAQQQGPLVQRSAAGLGLSPNTVAANAYPNPFVDRTTVRFELGTAANVRIVVSDLTGRRVGTVTPARNFTTGIHELAWAPGREVAPGQYIATVYSGNTVLQSVRIERR